jgi:hypothetical protein
MSIGKPKDGKSQVIVRFLSYRVREKVYNSKKELKRHPDKIFIAENLTKYRTNLVKALAELKYSRKIHAYWTTDGFGGVSIDHLCRFLYCIFFIYSLILLLWHFQTFLSYT